MKSLLLLLAVAARAVTIETVPPLTPPLSPTPALVQLRLDLAAVTMGPAPLRIASAISLAPDAAPSAVLAALSALPLAAPSAVPAAVPSAAPAATPAVETGAVARLAVAREILGHFDPAKFGELPPDRQDAALAALWDGWKSRGLLDGGADADRLIVEGVDDKALTHANKSVFLGVGVLGYPLEDALWLGRTRISDALDENALVYPSGQRWRNESGTPEFLGKSRRAQPLVDAWGAAAEYGAQVVRQVERGSRELPVATAVSPAAAADFARVVEDLVRSGDREALDYLTGRDPTFSAFLLDARKPGYYLYNGDKSVVARIMATPAARALGIRRVDRPDGMIASSYFYRPARVVARLREAAAENPGEDGDEGARAKLAAYADRLAAALPGGAPAGSADGFSFVAPEFLPGSALESALNRVPSGASGGERLELPLSLGRLRERLASGERYAQFTPARWEAFRFLLSKVPALSAAGDAVVVRFVAQPFQSGGKRVAAARGGGLTLQVSVLDEVARLRAEDAAGLERELRFLRAGIDAALSAD